MDKTVNIQLTGPQIDLLRGVLYEYYSTHTPHDENEESIRLQLEDILADAETECFNKFMTFFKNIEV